MSPKQPLRVIPNGRITRTASGRISLAKHTNLSATLTLPLTTTSSSSSSSSSSSRTIRSSINLNNTLIHSSDDLNHMFNSSSSKKINQKQNNEDRKVINENINRKQSLVSQSIRSSKRTRLSSAAQTHTDRDTHTDDNLIHKKKRQKLPNDVIPPVSPSVDTQEKETNHQTQSTPSDDVDVINKTNKDTINDSASSSSTLPSDTPHPHPHPSTLPPIQQLELLYHALHITYTPSTHTPSHISPSLPPSTVAGREKEYTHIFTLIQQCIQHQQGHSLYICGQPGTGKTYTIDTLLRQHFQTDIMMIQHNNQHDHDNTSSVTHSRINRVTRRNDLDIIYLNCITSAPKSTSSSSYSASHIYSMILDQLTHRYHQKPSSTYTSNDRYSELLHYILHSKKMILLILDECDTLHNNTSSSSTAPSVLHTLLYTLPSLPHSKLITLGLSNNIDLPLHIQQYSHIPARTSSHTQSSSIQAPPLCSTLVFQSYQSKELLSILIHRITEALQCVPIMCSYNDGQGQIQQKLPFFDVIALEYMCKKVSSVHGDIRRCMDITRKCVDQLIEKYRTGGTVNPITPSIHSQQHELVTTPSSPSSSTPTPPEYRITLPLMSQAINNMDSNHSLRDVNKKIQALPKQQQLLLCVASLHTYMHKRDCLMVTQQQKDRDKKVGVGRVKGTTYNGLRLYYDKCKITLKLPGYTDSEFYAMCDVLSETGLMSRDFTKNGKNQNLQRKSLGLINNQKKGDACYVVHVKISTIKHALQDNLFIQQLLTKAERSTVQWHDELEVLHQEMQQAKKMKQYENEDVPLWAVRH